MQNKRHSRLGLALGIIAGIVALSGCADVFQEPQAQSNTGEGRIIITIDASSPSRKVLPQSAQPTGTRYSRMREGIHPNWFILSIRNHKRQRFKSDSQRIVPGV